jgi:hypothetical protein
MRQASALYLELSSKPTGFKCQGFKCLTEVRVLTNNYASIQKQKCSCALAADEMALSSIFFFLRSIILLLE